MGYAVVIRSLGTDEDNLKSTLRSLAHQTVEPDSVAVCIPRGTATPSFNVMGEHYIFTAKGMATQRILPALESDSDYCLMIDDDIELAPDSAAKMLEVMESSEVDALGVDLFANHKMPLPGKLKAFLLSGVVPHFSSAYAVKCRYDGSFSYLNKPVRKLYESQSVPGGAWMVKKGVLQKYRISDELWIDTLEFAYGEDKLQTFKIFVNGGRVAMLYDSGIVHNDGGSASGGYRGDSRRIYIRTKAATALWHRTHFSASHSSLEKTATVMSFGLRNLVLAGIYSLKSVASLSLTPLKEFFRGLKEGLTLHNQHKIPPYRI